MGCGREPYHLLPVVSYQQNSNLTPSSAVSSFNLPATCDSSLITPIHTSSPSHHSMAHQSSNMRRSMEADLSPTTVSPPDLSLGTDEEYAKYNPPMKWKEPYRMNNSTADDAFPPSPVVCQDPYWGQYGVSTPQSIRTPHSATSMQQSPQSMSALSLSSTSDGSRSSGGFSVPSLSASSYRTAPVLLAANPSTYRSYGRHYISPLPSPYDSVRSPQGSQYSRRSSYSSGTPSTRANKRQGKKPNKDALYARMYNMRYDIKWLKAEDRHILEMKVRERLQWKQIMERFNAQWNKTMNIPALQMRLSRAGEKAEFEEINPGSKRSGASRHRCDSTDSGYGTAHSNYNAVPDQESMNVYSLLSPQSMIDERSTAPMPTYLPYR